MIGDVMKRMPFPVAFPASRKAPAEPVTRAAVPRRSYRLPAETEISPEDVQEMISKGVEIVSGDEARRFPIPKSARGFICLMANGTLLVTKGQNNHPAIPELLEKMERADFRLLAVHVVDMETIQSLYDRGSRKSVAENDVERMVKDVLALFEEAIDYNATDIKIELKNGFGEVRLCVNDNWIDYRQYTPDYTRLFLASAYNLCSVSDGTYKEGEYQMARLSSEDQNLPRNLESVRMQFGPVAGNGRFLVARLLFSRMGAAARKTMEGLGYDPEHIALMRDIRATPFGVILMVGPTGSGKSTTLAVSLERRYEEMLKKINIVSIEDPPEYEIYGTLQLPISNVTREEERAQAFAMAFNSVLRMKPHVIMVGEVRDLPAAKLLIKASQSGHQCWSSLHTKNALTVPVRLTEMGIEPYLVKDSSILVGTIFQRLVPKLCECAIPFEMRLVSTEVGQMVDTVCEGDFTKARLRNVNGCAACNKDKRSNPGYVGQTVVAEVLQPDDEILTACVEGRRTEALTRWLEHPNAMTAFEHGLRKIYRGDVDADDVYKRVFDRHDLQRLQKDPGRVEFLRHGRKKGVIREAIAEIYAPAPPPMDTRMQNLVEAAEHVVDTKRLAAVGSRPTEEPDGFGGPAERIVPAHPRHPLRPAIPPPRPRAAPLRLSIPQGVAESGLLDARQRRP